MKKKIFVMIIPLILTGIFIAMFAIDMDRMNNNKPVLFSTWGYKYTPPILENEILEEETKKDMVIIKNGKIQNESLIDEFIEKTHCSKIESQELNILQDDKRIKITYTSGQYARIYQEGTEKEKISFNLPLNDGSFETRQKIYGYYSLIINDEEPIKFALQDHHIARTIHNDNVTLYFNAPLIEYTEIPIICNYSVESSNYSKKYNLVYNQRKDLGIKEIFNVGDYKIKTFGGDVTITIEGDMVYSLEEALNQKIITPDDLLSQAKMDFKYGICEQGMYKDGGSIEYCYYGEINNQYTILKLNTLNGEKDLIVGMGGQILTSYNKNKK